MKGGSAYRVLSPIVMKSKRKCTRLPLSMATGCGTVYSRRSLIFLFYLETKHHSDADYKRNSPRDDYNPIMKTPF